MFDINEIEGKILLSILENGTRRVEELESGKSIYLVNNRTEDKYKATFVKQNGSSYKVSMIPEAEGKQVKEKTLLTNGTLTTFIQDSVICMKVSENGLDIIAAKEVDIFM